LPDPTEGATVADWLSANGFEPLHRTSPAAAAADVSARALHLMIAAHTWAGSTRLQSVTRSRGQVVPTILIGQAVERRAAAVNAQTMYMARPIEKAVLACFVSMG